MVVVNGHVVEPRPFVRLRDTASVGEFQAARSALLALDLVGHGEDTRRMLAVTHEAVSDRVEVVPRVVPEPLDDLLPADPVRLAQLVYVRGELLVGLEFRAVPAPLCSDMTLDASCSRSCEEASAGTPIAC